MKALVLIACVALLSGCVHNEHRASEARAYYASQASLQQQRPPIFELVAHEGQTIELRGVQRLAVNDVRAEPIRELSQPEHPGWRLLDRALQVGGAVYGQRESSRMLTGVVGAIAGRASVQVGGDYITGSQHTGDYAGRDIISGHVGDYAGRDIISGTQHQGDYTGRDHAGRDLVAGNRTDTRTTTTTRIGIDINNENGRWDSPGPFDDRRGNCREGADCSVVPPPVEPPSEPVDPVDPIGPPRCTGFAPQLPGCIP